MELSEIQERLNKLDKEKLINVVKNYKQYGYNDAIRNYALSLLEKQGVSKSDLQLTGNFENKEFNLASDSYIAFNKNSKIAFVLYLIVISVKLFPPLLNIGADIFGLQILFIFYGSLIGYLIFLIMSFLNQSEFYRLVGDRYGAEGVVIYFFLGMPFYIVMYFVFRSQMNEKLKMID